MPVTCRVKRKIDVTHRLMKCTLCGAEHVVAVTVDEHGYWSSPRGSRDCSNAQCPSHGQKAPEKLIRVQQKAIENTPDDYDRPEAY